VILDTRLLLMAGVIALYLYDASLMLFRDEVVFTRGRRRWRGTLGSGMLLGGRYLVMPGAWTPGLPVFRACWSEARPRSDARVPMRVLLRALRPLQWASRVLAVLLFVALPMLLWLKPGTEWMLALVVGLYGIAIACVAWAWRCRRAFGLDGKGIALLAFDVVACPPFAVNVVMKLTLRLGLPRTAEVFAQRMLAPEAGVALMRAANARMHPGALDQEPTP
jgi:hypothetical protein